MEKILSSDILDILNSSNKLEQPFENFYITEEPKNLITEISNEISKWEIWSINRTGITSRNLRNYLMKLYNQILPFYQDFSPELYRTPLTKEYFLSVISHVIYILYRQESIAAQTRLRDLIPDFINEVRKDLGLKEILNYSFNDFQTTENSFQANQNSLFNRQARKRRDIAALIDTFINVTQEGDSVIAASNIIPIESTSVYYPDTSNLIPIGDIQRTLVDISEYLFYFVDLSLKLPLVVLWTPDVDVDQTFRYRVIPELESSTIISLLPRNRRTDKLSLRFTIWLGTVDINNSLMRSFVTLIWNLVDNTIEVEYQAVSVQRTGRKIDSDSDLFLTITPEKAINILVESYKGRISMSGEANQTITSAEFNIYFFDLKEESFLFALFNDLQFRNMLYLEERTNSYAFKKRLKISYNSPLGEEKEILNLRTVTSYLKNTAKISGTFYTGTSDELTSPLFFLTPEGLIQKSTVIPNGTPLVKIKISRSETPELITEFRYALMIYISKYLSIRGEIDKEISATGFLPVDTKPKAGVKIPEKKAIAIIQEFLKAYGSSDTKSRNGKKKKGVYSKECQREQPTVIPESEVDDYLAQSFTHRDKNGNVSTYQREVLAYPVVKSDKYPTFYYTCLGKTRPFISLVTVNDPEIKDPIYRFQPCCHAAPLLQRARLKMHYAYTRDFESLLDLERTSGSTGRSIGRIQRINYGNTADVYGTIVKMITNYFESPQEVFRAGSIQSDLSIFSAIFEALKDIDTRDVIQDYHNRTNPEERIRLFVQEWEELVNSTDIIDLCAQQLAASPESISQLYEVTEPFDALIWYRALEEKYNINLVFIDLLGEPIVPPFMDFYTTYFTERETLIIAVDDAGIGIQYEPVFITRQRDRIMTFDPELTRIVRKYLLTKVTPYRYNLLNYTIDNIEIDFQLTDPKKTTLPLLNIYNILGQSYNDRGKVCRLRLDVNGSEVDFWCNPEIETVVGVPLIPQSEFLPLNTLVNEDLITAKDDNGVWYGDMYALYSGEVGGDLVIRKAPEVGVVTLTNQFAEYRQLFLQSQLLYRLVLWLSYYYGNEAADYLLLDESVTYDVSGFSGFLPLFGDLASRENDRNVIDELIATRMVRDGRVIVNDSLLLDKLYWLLGYVYYDTHDIDIVPEFLQENRRSFSEEEFKYYLIQNLRRSRGRAKKVLRSSDINLLERGVPQTVQYEDEVYVFNAPEVKNITEGTVFRLDEAGKLELPRGSVRDSDIIWLRIETSKGASYVFYRGFVVIK